MKYRYRTDNEMKDSGVEWLGKIPKEWGVTKLKNHFEFEKGKNAALYTNDYIGLNEGNYPVYSGQTENNGVMGKINSYDYNLEKCIFTTTVGAKVMTPLLLKGKFNLSQNCLIMRGYNIFEEYIYYLLFPMFRYEKSLIPSYMQPSLRIDDLKKFHISYPDKVEQQKIALFLDKKTAEFDSIIEKKQSFIIKLTEAKKSLISEVVTGKVKVQVIDNKYQVISRADDEMKDSGVEWIGKIPKEWEVKRLKQISSIISKGTTPSTVGREIIEKGTVRFLKAENINNNFVSKEPEFFIDNETNKILKRSNLLENDILFVIAGATIGKASLLDKELCPANTNQAVSFIRLKKNENHKFILFWILSSKIQEIMWLFAVQSAQPNLSMENLGNFYCPYPKSQEQQLIVDFLDEKTAKIDSTIEKINLQIEKLKGAKQSLISEAVTGKIEVI